MADRVFEWVKDSMWWFLIADGVEYRHVTVWEQPGGGWEWTKIGGFSGGIEDTREAAQAAAEKAWLAWWVEATVRANRHRQAPGRGVASVPSDDTRLEGIQSAARVAWDAWDRYVTSAPGPMDWAHATIDLGDAMAGLATWLPGYNPETGKLDEEDDE